MHHRESSDKFVMSEPEVDNCRYAQSREEIEASAKPAMFYHLVQMPSSVISSDFSVSVNFTMPLTLSYRVRKEKIKKKRGWRNPKNLYASQLVTCMYRFADLYKYPLDDVYPVVSPCKRKESLLSFSSNRGECLVSTTRVDFTHRTSLPSVTVD